MKTEENLEDVEFDFDMDFKTNFLFHIVLVIGLIASPFVWLHDKLEAWKEKRNFVRSLRR